MVLRVVGRCDKPPTDFQSLVTHLHHLARQFAVPLATQRPGDSVVCLVGRVCSAFQSKIREHFPDRASTFLRWKKVEKPASYLRMMALPRHRAGKLRATHRIAKHP